MRPHNWSATLNEIVACYWSGERDRERERRWWLADGLLFRGCLQRVGHAEIEDGRRHSHQRRLPQSVLHACAAALEAAEADIQSAPRFHQLFKIIETSFAPIRGAGELAVYDAADRLRHRLGLESENLVYLHAGARVGARRLAGGRLPRDDGRSILHSQLPAELRALSTHEAEDVLCIFKDHFFTSPEAVRDHWARMSGAACAGSMGPRC